MDNTVTWKYCEEKHKAVDAKIGVQDKRIDHHGERLDKLENNQIRTEVVVQNLCDQIKALVETMKSQQTEQREQQKAQMRWLLAASGSIIGILVGFFIWYIQSLPR